jgi:NTP pyrophosphatase (non-canonical NTP hydrolase)
VSGALTPEKRRDLTIDERTQRYVLMGRVEAELARQDKKWGVPCAQAQTAERRFTILAEEFGEVADAIDRSTPSAAVTELVQVAAVAIANAERFEAGIDDTCIPRLRKTDEPHEARFVLVGCALEDYARALLDHDLAAASDAAYRVAEQAGIAAQILEAALQGNSQTPNNSNATAHCPVCYIERADYEGEPGKYLPRCPNCSTTVAPVVRT